MFSRIIRSLSFMFCLVFFANTLFAQALFRVGSATPTAVDIGQTELTGSITMTVVSGTTVAAPFVITYSAPITNSSAADISIQGIGTLSGIAPTPELDRDANAIIVHVMAGGTADSSIIISGVRVAIAGLGFSHVAATIESPVAGGNSIVVGETNPVVIRSLSGPFSISPNGPPLSYGVESNDHASLAIREGFQNAFAGNSGIGGQTVPTQIRITPFPSIPDGVQLAFSAVAISPETGATLTTQSGLSETVPRTDGSTDVVYEFASGSESSVTIESFQISIAMTFSEPLYTPFIIQFQATLVPIGLAVPTLEFPSTAIPRYLERMVPDETELLSGSTELFFPFQAANADTYTGIALTNPQDYRVLVTLTAYSDNGTMISGAGISNPVTITMPRKGQYAKVASEIFGRDFNASSSGTIRATGRTEELAGFYMIGDWVGPKLDGSTGLISNNRNWYLPLIFRQGSSPYNMLEIHNPGAAETTATLRLMNADGIQVSSAAITIPASGTLIRDIQDVFGVNLNSFHGGYIKGLSDSPIAIHNTFGNSIEFSVLNAQTIDIKRFYYIPHFAAGGPYATELTLVNVDTANTAEITLTLLDNSGGTISIPGNPASITISSRKQMTSSLAELFPSIGPELLTGAIRVEVKLHKLGPFETGPSLIGAARFQAADGSASTAIPLVLNPSSDFIYSHVAQNPDYFTGVVLLNANSQASNFKLDVYSKEGAPVGSYSSVLQPGERISKLLYELVPASAGQIGGYIRIISDTDLTSFAFFGTNDIRSLSAMPPQNPR
jgi:hypothetical protein